MKIYTKTGDKGETGLLGGSRVPKNDPRIEAYGTIDELNSHLGMLRDLATPHHTALITVIQSTLFAIGSRLASNSTEEADKFQVPQVTDSDVSELEKAMDMMDADLEPMRNFILPGGHPSAAALHLARSVCRRAEVDALQLHETEPLNPALLICLNRLSDLLFVLARAANNNGQTDVLWKPGKGLMQDP